MNSKVMRRVAEETLEKTTGKKAPAERDMVE